MWGARGAWVQRISLLLQQNHHQIEYEKSADVDDEHDDDDDDDDDNGDDDDDATSGYAASMESHPHSPGFVSHCPRRSKA